MVRRLVPLAAVGRGVGGAEDLRLLASIGVPLRDRTSAGAHGAGGRPEGEAGRRFVLDRVDGGVDDGRLAGGRRALERAAQVGGAVDVLAVAAHRAGNLVVADGGVD